MTRRHVGAALLLATSVVCVSLPGCSSSASDEGDEAGAGGEGGEGGTSGAPGGAAGLPDKVVGPRGQAFVPADLELRYVGNGSSGGLEIVAASLLQSAGVFEAPAWYVAVRNTGFDTICSIYLSTELFDAAGGSLGSDPLEFLSTPMFLGPDGFEDCLGPDDVGMVEVDLGLENVIVSEVARIDYAFTAFVQEGMTRIDDVELRNLEVATSAGEEPVMNGLLHNGLPVAIYGPRVDFYAVDALGRPYARMWTIDLVEVAPGESWPFTTLGLYAELDGYVSFYSFSEPLL